MTLIRHPNLHPHTGVMTNQLEQTPPKVDPLDMRRTTLLTCPSWAVQIWWVYLVAWWTFRFFFSVFGGGGREEASEKVAGWGGFEFTMEGGVIRGGGLGGGEGARAMAVRTGGAKFVRGLLGPRTPPLNRWHRNGVKSGNRFESMLNRCQIDPRGGEGETDSRVGSGVLCLIDPSQG